MSVERVARTRTRLKSKIPWMLLALLVVLATRCSSLAYGPAFHGAARARAGKPTARLRTAMSFKSEATEEKEERREFATQVSRDVAVWMILAFATSGTEWAPYVIYAGAASVAFAVCYQAYNAWEKSRK